MRYHQLGRTGLEASELSLATAPLSGVFGSLYEAETLRLVDETIHPGITPLDTSPYYGQRRGASRQGAQGNATGSS